MPSPAERPEGGKESAVSKIFWMLVGVIITALAAIPIAYYTVDPLIPKARVLSSIESSSRRANDNAQVIIFRITNTGSNLTSNEVTISFEFRRALLPTFDVYKVADVYSDGDARCNKTVDDGDYIDLNVSFVCPFIAPAESRRFRFNQLSKTDPSMFKPSDMIIVRITHDGYTLETDYRRCETKPDEYFGRNTYYGSNAYYIESNSYYTDSSSCAERQ